MGRRHIPIGNEDTMLNAIARISGHFIEGVWWDLNESQSNAIYDPLVLVCQMYNDDAFDFDGDFYSKQYQDLLRCIPKRCMNVEYDAVLD